MANTSATGGYLSPATSPSPLEGQALLNFLQEWMTAITGLQGKNFRPRWQPEPPNIPSVNTDWAAFGVTATESDTFAVEIPDPSGNSVQFRRHEVLEVLVSFYGPNAESYARLLRDSAQIGQNREVLGANGYGLVEITDMRNVPDLIKEKWVKRTDIRVYIRRQVLRSFAILNLLGFVGSINNEVYTETLSS